MGFDSLERPSKFAKTITFGGAALAAKAWKLVDWDNKMSEAAKRNIEFFQQQAQNQREQAGL